MKLFSYNNHNTTTEGYFYLFRDYLGSIMAITDSDGAIKEKRIFDAWGEVVKITDPNNNVLSNFVILDRGYTGHEHLLGVGLVHMNGRLYDPRLHRFLMPDNYVQDPYSTQNFNRYGYVLNNPLSYTDPSGELIFGFVIVGAIIGALTAGAAYIAHAIQTGSWNWGQFGMSLLGGAIIGAITAGQLPASISVGYVTSSIAAGFAAGLLPSANFSLGNWNFSISPSIALGNGFGAGASFSASFSDGHFSFSGGVGVTYYGNYSGLGISGTEFRKSLQASWDDGGKGLTLGTNFWGGSGGLKDLNQRTGLLGLHSGDFRATYENDGTPFAGWSGDGGDSFRSAALQLNYKDYSIGFKLFTGKREYVPGEDSPPQVGSNSVDGYGRRYPNGYVKEVGNPYRLGALYAGYKGFRAGVNSEHVRHAIQDQAIHNLNILGIIDKRQPGFANQSWGWKSYFQYQTANSYTLW